MLRSGAEGSACGNLLREMSTDRVYNVLQSKAAMPRRHLHSDRRSESWKLASNS
jgi:hypothetical protein